MNIVRLKKEYQECSSEKEAEIDVELVGDNLSHWKGKIGGPKNTPYEGGTFVVDIKVPSEYPFMPPKMRFDTKLWHPNVSSANGAICLDILKDQWSPALTMRTALLSLQALLSCPNPDDPQDAQVAGQYKKDRKAFEATAKFWTDSYAKKDAKTALDSKVTQLVSMGFDKDKVIYALGKHNGNENQALDYLISNA